MRKLTRAVPIAALSIAVLSPCHAVATEQFPTSLAAQLTLDYVPDCSLCHSRGVTGAGTATSPFALAMKERGLQPGNVASLGQALQAMTRDGVDSDGDGATDIEELSRGTSPNSPSAGASLRDNEGPSYGCSVTPARVGRARSPTVLAALSTLGALGVALLRRRRRPVTQ